MKCYTPAILLVLITSLACSNQNDSDKQAVNEAIPQQGEIEIDGFPLKYIRKGEGSPFLVIGSAAYYSQAFSDDLEDQFELIYIDSRHFVPDCKVSEEALDKLKISTFSDDVEAVRGYLGLEKVGVIGHSVHAQIALDYAVRFPEHTSQVVLICGVPYQGEEIQSLNDQHWAADADEVRKAKLKANLEIMQTLTDGTPPDKYFSLTYHYNAPRYWADPGFDATALLADLRTCPQVMGKLFGSVPTKEEVQAKVDQLSMPTLVILGKLDFAIPYQAWEGLLANRENIHYVLMDEAGHNPQTEPATARAFDEHLLAWEAGLQ